MGEEVYNRADMSTEEVTEWLEALTTEQFGRLMEFFRTMPKLTHTSNSTTLTPRVTLRLCLLDCLIFSNSDDAH